MFDSLMVLLACWLAGAQHIFLVLQSGVQIFVNGSGPSGRRSGFVFCANCGMTPVRLKIKAGHVE